MSSLVTPELEAQAIAWRRHLHAHPELSFEEHETSAFLFELLGGLDGLELERPTETSLVAIMRTGRPGKTLALRADIDALPIQEETGLEFASENPGVMHACGHDGHTAMLLATLNALHERRDELTGEIRFIFQHAEELAAGRRGRARRGGRDGRRRMVVGCSPVLARGAGKVGVLCGPHTAASDVFTFEIRGKGGHGASPHESSTRSPPPHRSSAASSTSSRAAVDPIERAVVSVTQIRAAGQPTTSSRSRSSSAGPCGPSRRRCAPPCDRDGALREGDRREAHGCTSTFEYVEGYDPVVNDDEAAALVERGRREELGEDAFFVPPPIMGGEDFSAYLSGGTGCVLHRRRGWGGLTPAPPSPLTTGTRARCGAASRCSRGSRWIT